MTNKYLVYNLRKKYPKDVLLSKKSFDLIVNTISLTGYGDNTETGTVDSYIQELCDEFSNMYIKLNQIHEMSQELCDISNRQVG